MSFHLLHVCYCPCPNSARVVGGLLLGQLLGALGSGLVQLVTGVVLLLLLVIVDGGDSLLATAGLGLGLGLGVGTGALDRLGGGSAGSTVVSGAVVAANGDKLGLGKSPVSCFSGWGRGYGMQYDVQKDSPNLVSRVGLLVTSKLGQSIPIDGNLKKVGDLVRRGLRSERLGK